MHPKLVTLTVAILHRVFSFIPLYKKRRMAKRCNEKFNLMAYLYHTLNVVTADLMFVI